MSENIEGTKASSVTVPSQGESETSKNTEKAKKQKKSAVNKGQKKSRTLSEVQFAECVKQLVADEKDGLFPEGKVPMSAYTKKFNVTASLFKDIYIGALEEGMPYRSLLKDSVKKVSEGTCYIDSRGMCMIAKHFFLKFNENLPDDEKFKPGQKFKPSQEGRNIILSPIE